MALMAFIKLTKYLWLQVKYFRINLMWFKRSIS